MTKRRNLVIVRAGDSSLHEGWLAGAGERNWDLIVNYFGDDPARYRVDGVRRIDSKGPKWPALQALIGEFGEDIFGYDHIWLPDDDLRTDKAAINTLFGICAQCSLALAQPALTPDSHLGHLITLRNRSFALRFTNFVEIMAPCFSRDFLQAALPSFGENQTGWGLDYYWPTKIDNWTHIAIVDASIVCHTRPVGGPNYRHLAAGKTAVEEMRELLARHGLTREEPYVRGGIDKAGRALSMYDATAADLIEAIVTGYLPETGRFGETLMKLVRPNLAQLSRNAAVPPAKPVLKSA